MEKKKRAKRNLSEYKKNPNDKQKKVLAIALKNAGKLQPAMKEAGYAKGYAKNPKELTETKSWAVLLKEYLPDDLLTKVAQEGLEATTEPGGKLPDYVVRHKYLETALKMKNKLISKTDVTSDGERVVGFTIISPETI